ncbi:MAG: rRNA pseudouridine synthase [Cyanobacteria bacterium REEB65]|nr:rRNA pseudouridine synthase [Cyanobacteria bacterium REEB65]
MSGPERLQKILAQAGIASRRAAEAFITAGRVAVNGQVVSDLGVRADPARDEIRVDGRPIPPRSRPRVLALYKPPGFVSTCRDDRGRRTVMDLVPSIAGLHPVGRLDYDTSGLLLLSNDGEVTLAVTHPRHELDKTYLATVSGRPTDAALGELSRGLLLADGMTSPVEVQIVRMVPGGCQVRLTLHEGRKRQVRRMLAAIGHPVRQLVRTSVGPIDLSGLQPGCWRELSGDEVECLRIAAQSPNGTSAEVPARMP